MNVIENFIKALDKYKATKTATP